MATPGSPLLREKTREMRRVFGAIHDANNWGDGESKSGPGSTRDRAASFLPDLIALVRSLGPKILLDAPCGDFNWAAPLADVVDSYIGVDVVPALILSNERRWAAPHRQFLCRDIVSERLPAADLVFCRDALVHLGSADILLAIANLRKTGAMHLLTTTFIGNRGNEDIQTGQWRPLNLQLPPFNFPTPVTLIDERCHHTDGIYSDKRIGVWRFQDIPEFKSNT